MNRRGACRPRNKKPKRRRYGFREEGKECGLEEERGSAAAREKSSSSVAGRGARLWRLGVRGRLGRGRVLLPLASASSLLGSSSSSPPGASSHSGVHRVRARATTHHLIPVHKGPDLALCRVGAEEVAEDVHGRLLGVGVLALLGQLDQRTG